MHAFGYGTGHVRTQYRRLCVEGVHFSFTLLSLDSCLGGRVKPAIFPAAKTSRLSMSGLSPVPIGS